MNKIAEWAAGIDWDKRNAVIAEETGVPVTAVIKRRTKYGRPSTAPRKERRDAAERIAQFRTPESRDRSRANQPLATAAAKKSPRSGRGVGNVHATDWHILSPTGVEYKFKNLHEFVRSNPGLFVENDRTWKRKSGTGGEYCNATSGIGSLKNGGSKIWKGWTMAAPPSPQSRPARK